MKPFIHKDFILSNAYAKELYHEHASHLPILDYHCHLEPEVIAENRPFRSITELWLAGDHYKWRAMRANGVDEKYITGDASDWEKFQKWAETIPYTMRNPLYHWTHMELKTAFGIDDMLTPESARKIFDTCNEMLASADRTPRGLMEKYNVELVCTTDDPVDSLVYHAQLAESDFPVRVLPAWRPDNVMAVDKPEFFRSYVEKLSAVSGRNISDFDDLVNALQDRHDYFSSRGCCLADHGVSDFPYAEFTSAEIEAIFNKVYGGKTLAREEILKFQTAMLSILCGMNHDAGWVQQFHYGPLRNTNTKMLHRIGINTGFDTIGEVNNCSAIAKFLDRLELSDKLGKTILYNINPADNDMLAAMIANFQDGSVPGKIQFGAAWWFNDQMNGILRQLESLSNQGLLSRFVGMLTDSRSFLSYTRHEYFRRILCNLLGQDLENGYLPVSQIDRVGQMVEDISYFNAKNYFRF